MAKIDSLSMIRWRLAALPRPPWMMIVLLLGDLVELGASFALAAASQPPPTVHVAYATFDVPTTPPQTTLGVAMLGIAVGLLIGASLVAELVWMIRRMMFERSRYRSRRIAA